MRRLSGALRQVAVDLPPGDGSRRFLAEARTHGALEVALNRFVGLFLHQNSAAAVVGTHDMALIDADQLEALLAKGGAALPERGATLLDVGAGSGAVTSRIAARFDAVTTTEACWACAWRLAQRGYAVVRGENALQALVAEQRRYDVVTMFNVLDRTANPREMLRDARAMLRENSGVLLVALALPLEHFVVGSSGADALREGLVRDERAGEEEGADARWAATATALAEELFQPLGLETVALSRVPYRCVGHSRDEIWDLDDAVFALRRVEVGIPRDRLE